MSDTPALEGADEIRLVTDRRRVLLGGGLLIGFTVASTKTWAASNKTARVNPQAPQPVSTKKPPDNVGAAFTGQNPEALIHIAPPNQITLIMPNVEMGQGIFTGEAMLLAEELEVDLDQVTCVAAPPNEALYKHPLLQLQATGGSTSIKGSFVPFRQAAALARIMLIEAAAQQWSVPATDCIAQRGQVIHRPSGRSLLYGSLADAAMRQPRPDAIPLKPPSQWRLLGKPLPRVDTPSKVDGQTKFGIDIAVPGMKIAAVEMCPVLGGTLAGVDDSAARAIPGYVQTVRLPDAVAVIGEHFWAAQLGVRALKIDWAPGPNASLSSADLWAQMEKASQAGPGAVAVQKGDLDQAFHNAAKRVEAEYRLPFLAHATLEPMSAVIHATAGGAQVWCGTQVPTRAVDVVAKIVGCAPEKVVLENQMIGGGYGRKLETDYVEQAAAIARQCAFPVKLVWSRKQDMQHDRYRPMYLDRMSAALDADGRPVGWMQRVCSPSVTARWAPGGMRPNGVDPDAVEECEDPVYGQFPAMRVDYVQHHQPPGVIVAWWRSVGPYHATFVVESFIDELAHAAGKDPLAYRLDLTRSVPRAHAVLEKVRDASGWGSPLPPRCGRGVIVQKCFGAYIAAVVEAGVSDDGDVTLRRITAVVDCGYTVNPRLVAQQMEGGLIFGLTAALYQGITLQNGRVQQSNFHDYRMLRIDETPAPDIILAPTENPPGGIGEAPVTTCAPALCNAIFAATGVRLREMPVDRRLIARDAKQGVAPFTAALAVLGVAAAEGLATAEAQPTEADDASSSYAS
ncbi:MAG TPA: xanthine dehydrogenase family protein molybdopterin-binding subunit [Caulobacteraceae bacterium]|jgi:isoquinoline 1-oxidoreductase beta subunit|nr:xanthine dehydrogenase family protein molybdopterin-binding subunit [Caulobacteraceae bacterium]